MVKLERKFNTGDIVIFSYGTSIQIFGIAQIVSVVKPGDIIRVDPYENKYFSEVICYYSNYIDIFDFTWSGGILSLNEYKKQYTGRYVISQESSLTLLSI